MFKSNFKLKVQKSQENTLNCNSRSSAKTIVMSNFDESTGDKCRYAIRAYNTNVCQVKLHHYRKYVSRFTFSLFL